MILQRYVFTLNHILSLGTTAEFSEKIVFDLTCERVERLCVNAPCKKFVTDLQVQIGNRVWTFPDGWLTRGLQFNPHPLRYEPLDAEIRMGELVSVRGKYTGLLPKEFLKDSSYLLAISFMCRSTSKEETA